jgi:hypothetical protein
VRCSAPNECAVSPAGGREFTGRVPSVNPSQQLRFSGGEDNGLDCSPKTPSNLLDEASYFTFTPCAQIGDWTGRYLSAWETLAAFQESIMTLLHAEVYDALREVAPGETALKAAIALSRATSCSSPTSELEGLREDIRNLKWLAAAHLLLERIRLKPAHILRRRRNLRIRWRRTPSAMRRSCSTGRRWSAPRLCGAEL